MKHPKFAYVYLPFFKGFDNIFPALVQTIDSDGEACLIYLDGVYEDSVRAFHYNDPNKPAYKDAPFWVYAEEIGVMMAVIQDVERKKHLQKLAGL